MIIRELEFDDDYRQYCTLLKQLTSMNLEEITENQFYDQLKIIKANPFHKIIIAECDGKIVGSITILIEAKMIHNFSRVSHIEDLVVDVEYRMNGIGGMLMNKAIEISRQYYCYKIILDCNEKNVNFYQKFGFVKKETQMAFYLS